MHTINLHRMKSWAKQGKRHWLAGYGDWPKVPATGHSP